MPADQIFIVQRRDGDVMISLFAGEDRPEEATPEVAKQVSMQDACILQSYSCGCRDVQKHFPSAQNAHAIGTRTD